MYKICCKGTHILLNNNQVQSFFSKKRAFWRFCHDWKTQKTET